MATYTYLLSYLIDTHMNKLWMDTRRKELNKFLSFANFQYEFLIFL